MESNQQVNMERRSLAGSDAYFVQNRQAAWSDWSIEKAVNEGFQANPWVFRAVQIITQNASSVPWVVFDAKGVPIPGHHLSVLFARPNPIYPAQRLMEMIVLWLELGGNGYLKKVMVGQRTVELWPISPDRIAPIPSLDPALFIDGYKLRQDGGREVASPDYNAQTVIHFGFTNPANPYLGISPLGAAAKAADVDNAQAAWNAATMQNRGVIDGVFTFKRTLDPAQSTSIMERIKEKFAGVKNSRKPLVIGDDATYTKLALTPVEMDFLSSRKNNREEILSVFGVPPQLVGSQESSTYNNYAASLRILWKSTVIPLLDLIRSSLNHSFATELNPGETLGYDTSGVAAMQESDAEKIGTGKVLYEMGVPVSVINQVLGLNIPEYPGWDKAKAPAPPPMPPPPEEPAAAGTRSFDLVPLEQRSVDSDAKLRDKLAEGRVFSAVNDVLMAQSAAVLSAIEAGRDPVLAAQEFTPEWTKVLAVAYEETAYELALRVAVPRSAARGEGIEVRENTPYSQELMDAIKLVLQREGIVLTDLAHIQGGLVEMILKQTEYVVANGLPISALAQALTDTGVFSPERALRIARTTAGTAGSVGQLEAGRMAGATHKQWLTSKADTRNAHAARDGEVVPVDGVFSIQLGTTAPRYPLDANLTAADRINCRCFMSFSFRP